MRFMLDMMEIAKCPLQLNESNSVSDYMKEMEIRNNCV